MSKQPPPAPTTSAVGLCPTIIQISWTPQALDFDCFVLNGPLRQYVSLYRAVSQREGERKEKRQTRKKMSKQPTPAHTASAVGPCPTLIQISRTPRHWKFTQHHRTTRPPLPSTGSLPSTITPPDNPAECGALKDWKLNIFKIG